jgi:uncharacterized protein YyaL (SSP411 family)
MLKIAEEKGITADEAKQRIEAACEKLLAERAGRIRPLTDDKCLLSWNALMNIALSKAATTLQQEQYEKMATEHMRWMLEKYDGADGLKHTWKKGTAKIPAKLDDYAYLIQALLQLASATGENRWILKANELTETVVKTFSFENGFFYFTPEGQADIPVRKVDLYDGATPSANALMAHNLWICGMCMEKSEWIERADKMIDSMSDTALRYSYSFGYWAQLLQRRAVGMKTMICAGEDARKTASLLQSHSVPHSYIVTLGKNEYELPVLEKKFFAGKMYIFVCSEQACLSPVSSVEAALSLIN